MVEYKIVSQYEDTPRIIVHERKHPTFEAKLALNLIEKWGLVAAESDGEDSAGFESVDLIVWDNKKYRPQPLLCDGDGPILVWREWFSQFYAEPHEPA